MIKVPVSALHIAEYMSGKNVSIGLTYVHDKRSSHGLPSSWSVTPNAVPITGDLMIKVPVSALH
ncbi:hypothetical protein NLB25_27715, partial [Klebsiella pneumoniae]|nr:hypothetical protein [Klebsiella pneumoniae]